MNVPGMHRPAESCMKKQLQIFYIALMTVSILLPVVFFTLFKSHFDTANYENRTLAEMPALSADRASIEAFPNGFTNWFNDHLPFRNQLLTLNGRIDYSVLHSSSSETVIVGKEGWLFYKGAQVNAEDPVADYQGTNLFTDEELEKIRYNMERARDRLAERGCKFMIFMAPNKERVYSEFMPDAYGEPAEKCRYFQVLEYLRENTDIPVVDAYEPIMSYKNPEETLYFKYDTHWNELGAYRASRVLAEELGYSLPTMDIVQMEDRGVGNFDLARMIHLGRVLVKDHAYDITKYSPYYIEQEKNAESTEFRFYNPGNEGEHEKLMIIGDSFSMLFSPFIASFYNNTYVTFYYKYRPQMLEEENPSVVIYETVERYMGNMLDFNLDEGVGKHLLAQ